MSTKSYSVLKLFTGFTQAALIISLPLEVLQIIGQLNHLSSNMNQFARRMNMNDRFTISDYINFSKLTVEIKAILPLIKSYLQ